MDYLYVPFFMCLCVYAFLIHDELTEIRNLLEKKFSEDKED